MHDFIWVLPRDKAASLGEVGVSTTYILPRAHVTVDASELIGKFIWVVFRGENDRLALVLKAQEVDTILDGYYQDDFVLKPDLQNSLRIGSSFNKLASFAIEFASKAGEGFSEISLTDAEKFLLLLKNNNTVRLIPPANKILTNFIVENPPRNQALLARMVTQIAVSSFNFNDIWCDGRHKKYRSAPYASMAKAYIEHKFPRINLLEIDNELVSSDPYTSILNRKFEIDKSEQMSIPNGQAPRVDAIFKVLDPNQIYSRKFSAADLSMLDSIERIKKTEAAEHRHQEILRDVARYLLGEGIQPFQSGSVDLAYKLDETLQVFEIKTTNFENAISQAAKGAFQLACYKNALALDYESIAISLLLEDTGNADLNSFILQTMETLGISTYFYKVEIPWPDRLPNLPLQLLKVTK